MVIDDSPVQAEFLSSILKDDYEVSVFHTTQEGLEAAKAGGYSLILLDVVMPGMDGFTLLILVELDMGVDPRLDNHRAERLGHIVHRPQKKPPLLILHV